ncbi:hypothetical protein Pla52o_26160 [Novipirellula galeiformis]|uniref:Uncharacterized protein n=1 Tax=Novipirellula galeiformis TaxID=2528004 RepID=A0A5C6CFY5_9BACT|nr:hypothetical protein Pla52o_26160 [Novipirellula galeiformis]
MRASEPRRRQPPPKEQGKARAKQKHDMNVFYNQIVQPFIPLRLTGDNQKRSKKHAESP